MDRLTITLEQDGRTIHLSQEIDDEFHGKTWMEHLDTFLSAMRGYGYSIDEDHVQVRKWRPSVKISTHNFIENNGSVVFDDPWEQVVVILRNGDLHWGCYADFGWRLTGEDEDVIFYREENTKYPEQKERVNSHD